MKKYVLDMVVKENIHIHSKHALLKLSPSDGSLLPPAEPGQFVEVKVEGEPKTYLRRPISINYIDRDKNELWLLVQQVGAGTSRMSEMQSGSIINIIYPLGKGFSLPAEKNGKVLLVGGGVGVAPLLYWGAELKRQGYSPEFLLGAKSDKDLLQKSEFEAIAKTYYTTEDGSEGEKGFVTNHTLWQKEKYDKLYCCGPRLMMLAVAKMATRLCLDCEVSLENEMACGLGACLCCVENTIKGNVCVCKEGPVFNIKELQWLI